MKPKKIPMRSCIVTREKHEKRDLIRVVKDKDNNLSVDLTGKKSGRGAYLKRDTQVIEKAKKSKILTRVLEIEIPDDIYEELLNIIK